MSPELKDIDSPPITITFLSNVAWTTRDLELFSRSVTRIYDSRLATYLWSTRAALNFERRREWIRKSIIALKQHLPGPVIYEWSEAWLGILEKGGGYPDLYALAFPFPVGVYPVGDSLTPQQIFHAIDLYGNPQQACRIVRAEMGSPGGFSFTGIGEIVKEFRELIKDVWFRNRQEEQKGELDLQKGKLDLIEKYLALQDRLPANPELVITVSEGIEGLQSLERDGKLRAVDECIDKPGEL
jgi:hypothetical protein